jgi:hypothetical protein
MQEHYQSGGGSLQAISWEDDQAPWEVEGDDRLKNVYEANAPIILENHQESSVSSSYNVPLTNDFTVPEMMEHAERIYDRQGHAFRLNLEFGLTLRHTKPARTDISVHLPTNPCSSVPSTFPDVKT